MPVPGGLPRYDPEGPSSGRLWNFLLGGGNYGEADEKAAGELIAACPQASRMARVNRLFGFRAVLYAADHGVTQFIDLGCGIPPRPHLHESARTVAAGVRGAYVDLDDLTLGELDAVIGGDGGVAAVRQDLRDPAAVLSDPGLAKVIDLDEPVLVLAAFVLHFLPPAKARAVVAGYAERAAAGSYVAVSVPCAGSAEALAAANGVLAPSRMHDYTAADVAKLFTATRGERRRGYAGLGLVPPGVAPAIGLQPGWEDCRREPPPGAYVIGGIGRKRLAGAQGRSRGLY